MSEESGYVGESYENVPQQDDYFLFQEEVKHFLPDGATWVTFKPMNEGAKSRFQKKTQRDMIVERGSGNARVKMDPSDERHELLTQSLTGWNLKRGPQRIDVPFNSTTLSSFLVDANPKIVEEIEKAIRKANPWMLADMKSADIQLEIDNLTEMLEVAKEREAGELASSNK